MVSSDFPAPRTISFHNDVRHDEAMGSSEASCYSSDSVRIDLEQLRLAGVLASTVLVVG